MDQLNTSSFFLMNESSAFFDMEMQDRLQRAIKPGMKYLCEVLLQEWRPLSMGALDYFEEGLALFMLLLERYSVSNYQSLFVERIFGYKRIRVETRREFPLTSKQELGTVLLPVVASYVQSRCSQIFEKHQSQEQASVGSSQHRNRLFAFWMLSYPIAHAGYEALSFIYKWRYLTHRTPYFSPFLHFLKIQLRRITPEDMTKLKQLRLDKRAQILQKWNTGPSHTHRLIRRLYRFSWTIRDYSHVLVFLSIVGYRFMQWYYSDEGQEKLHSYSSKAMMMAPPSGHAEPHLISIAKQQCERNHCFLCHRERINPTSSIGGFVFCYTCLYKYVEEHQRCPLTGIKGGTGTIRRIYEGGSA